MPNLGPAELVICLGGALVLGVLWLMVATVHRWIGRR